VYTYPRNRFTAEFLGRTNIIALNRAETDPSSGVVVAENGMRLRSRDTSRLKETDEPLVIAFRPEVITVSDDGGNSGASLPATVVSSQFLGGSAQLVLDLNGVPITAALSGEQLRKPNEKVSIAI